MKPRTAGVIGGSIGVIAIIVVLALGGSGVLNSVTGLGNPPVGNTPAPPVQIEGVTNKYTDLVNFQIKPANSGNGTAVTAGTAFTVQYLQMINGALQPLGTDTDGTESIKVGANDIVYAWVKIASGQKFLVDWTGTVAAQQDKTVGKPSYADPLNTGLASYIFPLDMSLTKAKADPQNTPTYEWYPRFTGEGTLSLATVTSVLNVGTGTKTTSVTEQLSIDQQPSSQGIKAAQITVNGTETTNEVQEGTSYMDFPNPTESSGVERVYLSEMSVSSDYTSGATKTILRHVWSASNIDGANIITVGGIGSKTWFIPVVIVTEMDASTDAVCMEFRVEPINARNVPGTALTDDVEFVAGATNDAECSV